MTKQMREKLKKQARKNEKAELEMTETTKEICSLIQKAVEADGAPAVCRELGISENYLVNLFRLAVPRIPEKLRQKLQNLRTKGPEEHAEDVHV